MNRALALAAVCFSTSLTIPSRAEVPPPPPAAPPPPPPAAAPAPDPLDSAEPAAEAAPPPAPSADASEGGEAASSAASSSAASSSAEADPEAATAAASGSEDGELDEAGKERVEQRKLQPGLDAGSGLFRSQHAGAGPVGTFRFGFLTSYFSDRAFLCPQCSDSDGGPGSTPDDVRRVGAHLQISATVARFLEAYMGVHSTATSNTRGDPVLLQVLGDSNWGLKLFTPRQPNKPFSVGGAAEMILLNGTGGVGVDNTSFALRLLASLDFANRENPKERTPLRFNFNFNYVFDNSGRLVEDIEAQRGQPISRIERYGLNVNRVDHFSPVLGVEGQFSTIRPYLEWSIDIPANRQGYLCAPADVFASDVCLQKHITFESAPSRFTLGARAHAFLDGLGFHAAFDLGTGGTTPPFWEEMQPESPWMVHLGVAYTADTKPQVRIKKLPPPPAPPPEEKPLLTIAGTVVEEGSETPIANAIVRAQGRPMTGMVTDDAGRFTTGPLEPGSYSFVVSAPDYEDATCTAEVQAAAPAAAPAKPEATPSAEGQPPAPPPAAAAAPVPSQDGTTELRCQLKALPKLGSVVLYVVDENGAGVAFAKVTAIDNLGRPLTIDADDQGGVAFANVPPGPLTIVAEAEGYFRSSQKLEVQEKAEARADITVFARPKRPNIEVAGDQLKLKKAIEFAPGTSQLLPESRAVVAELADLMRSKPELGPIEIQSHTDASGPPDIAQQLTTQRANVIREQLIQSGVTAPRVLARGYGSTEAKGPNTEAGKRKNNRVVLVVQKSTPLP